MIAENLCHCYIDRSQSKWNQTLRLTSALSSIFYEGAAGENPHITKWMYLNFGLWSVRAAVRKLFVRNCSLSIKGVHDGPEAFHVQDIKQFMAAVRHRILSDFECTMRHVHNETDPAFSANFMLSVIFQVCLVLYHRPTNRVKARARLAKDKFVPEAVSAKDPKYNEKNANQCNSPRGVAGCHS